MHKNNEIESKITDVIKEIAQLQKIQLPALKGSLEIVDELGFSSLQVAALIANLEEELGVDPFEDAEVMITDIRTIDDLCQVYTQCLSKS